MVSIEVFSGKDGLYRTHQTDMLCERPGIHSLHPHDAVFDQVVGQRFITSPVAEEGAVLFDDEAFHLRPLGLNILLIDSIIANEGIGHDDDLTFIGRVGKDFLIAGHAGIENDFT